MIKGVEQKETTRALSPFCIARQQNSSFSFLSNSSS